MTFDPDDIEELSQRFERAEAEEQATICAYIEMPYEAAAWLVENARRYEASKDVMALIELVNFAVAFANNTAQTMSEAGLDPDE